MSLINNVRRYQVDADSKLIPWYKRIQFSDVYGTDIDNRFMINAFTMLALQDGRAFTTTQFEGVLKCDNKHIKELFDSVLSKRGGYVAAQYIPFAADSNYRNWQYVWDEGVITVTYNDDDTSITIFAMHETDRDAIVDLIRPLSSKKRSAGKAFVMANTSNGIQMRAVSNSAKVAFEPGNYAPTVADKFKFMVEQFSSTSPNGRIMIFRGPPGTGKTHLIRALIGAVEHATFVVVPSSMIGELDGPNLIGTLVNTYSNADGPIVLILEDADTVLSPRLSDNMHSISSLLNLSDGILGSLMDLRIIATTNALKEELDSAVTRDGRLCADLEMGPLNYEHATKVYQRIMKDNLATLPEENAYTLAQIYKLARPDNGPSNDSQSKKSIGFVIDEEEVITPGVLSYEEVLANFGPELANDIAHDFKVIDRGDGNLEFEEIPGSPNGVKSLDVDTDAEGLDGDLSKHSISKNTSDASIDED